MINKSKLIQLFHVAIVTWNTQRVHNSKLFAELTVEELEYLHLLVRTEVEFHEQYMRK